MPVKEMEELIRSWHRAAPRHFCLDRITVDKKEGLVAVDLNEAFNEEKKKILQEGAKLVGFRVWITRKQAIFTRRTPRQESPEHAQSVPKRRGSRPR